MSIVTDCWNWCWTNNELAASQYVDGCVYELIFGIEIHESHEFISIRWLRHRAYSIPYSIGFFSNIQMFKWNNRLAFVNVGNKMTKCFELRHRKLKNKRNTDLMCEALPYPYCTLQNPRSVLFEPKRIWSFACLFYKWWK